MGSVDAREVSYARVCLALRPFRLFQLGDRYVHVLAGHDVEVPALVQRAERGRPSHADDEHVWLPPLEHWCAAIAHHVRARANRDLPRWELQQQVFRAIADACHDYPTVSAAEVAARLYADGAGAEVPPVTQTLPRIPAAEWRR
jgi:hypothetical protein